MNYYYYLVVYFCMLCLVLFGASCKFIYKNLEIIVLKNRKDFYKRKYKRLQVENSNLESMICQLNSLLNDSQKTNKLLVEDAQKLIDVNKKLNNIFKRS